MVFKHTKFVTKADIYRYTADLIIVRCRVNFDFSILKMLVDIAVAQAHGVFLISLGRYYAYVIACIQLLKSLFYLLLRNF